MDLENYFVILAIHSEENSLLRIYDQNFTSESVLILQYQNLCRKGYIIPSNTDSDGVWVLTEKAINLINQE